ncbi:hypothetical protein HHI36_010864 [Cryptolaemus montrouzieri]|uniref:TRAF-type domain-containing protein n=1 Tax=Cryptolaemus montrouzieri TaxID=559131 RepID=A0ABD2MK53_9CUCU
MSSNIGINSNSRLFVCYFCNREIKGETELGHTAVCGSVLIPCPNKCGVYTPRSDVASHCQKCPNKMTKRKNLMQSSLNSSTISIPDANSNNSQWSTSVPKTDIAIVGELKSLQNRCSIVEQYLNNLSIFNKNKTFVDSKEVDRLIIQMRILEEWRDIVNLKLENIRQQITQQELIKSETKDNWSKLRQYLLVFEKFKIDVSNIKETISREQNLNKQQYAEWNQKLTSLKQNMDEQTSLLMSLLKANEANISKIMNSISEMQKPLEELSSKFIALNFDVKALTRISTDAVERLEMQQRDFDAIKKNLIK